MKATAASIRSRQTARRCSSEWEVIRVPILVGVRDRRPLLRSLCGKPECAPPPRSSRQPLEGDWTDDPPSPSPSPFVTRRSPELSWLGFLPMLAARDHPPTLHPHDRPAPVVHDIAPLLRQLRRLPLPELVARISELHVDEASPVRKHVAEMIGEIGSKRMAYLPDMIPCLLHVLNDETPAVVRQSIKAGTNLFAKVLQQLVIQGLFSTGGIDESLKLSWEWLLKFKSAVSQMAFQTTSNEGARLLAVKFVEKTVLMYTPDPNIPSDPPNKATEDMGFNIAWLRGGHPLLNVGDLAMEASQSLGLLLEQLKFPKVKSLSTSMVIVFVSSLSAIAQRRPSFYGRILPVLLSLDPASCIIKLQIPGAFHALKSAFSACLKCTHSSAEPWRARLLEAQNIITQGDSIEHSENAVRNFGDTSNREESCPLMERSTDSSNKRSLAEGVNNMLEDDGHSSKRVRQSHDAQERTEEANKRNVDSTSVNATSSQPILTRIGISEAVYQLIGMFATLAAQGDRAAGSLQILSSSIASDLLADVVMVNMEHMPVSRPEVDQQQLPSTSSGDGLPSSSPFHLLASLMKRANQIDQDEVLPAKDSAVVPSVADDITTSPASSPVPTSVNPPMEENSNSPTVPLDIETTEAKVPSAGATSSVDIQESSEASHASTEPQGTQEHGGSFISSLPADNSSVGLSLAQSSETHSPSSSTVEANQSQLSSLNVLNSQYVLPKLVVSNIDISDEAKDLLQKEAFVRILESDKQEASGGSLARLPLLAHLGVEFPLELDPWELLQKHVLSDYINNEGHELTLCILNRLYREAEQDQDFLSSRTATSVYESFLLTVAENLRDMFPASDKSLGKLLCEIPYLPEGVLKLLEGLCSPGSNEKQDKDIQRGDRVTQGLSAVWNLIMIRPSSRDRCLEIALQSSTHHLEEVRMKAIRLVANKLFPMASISKKIEDFANEKLNSVLEVIPSADSAATESATPEAHKVVGLENLSASSVADAQTLMSLYFALCTKKHSLLRHVFAIYGGLPQAAKQAVHRQVPILIRTIGSSRDLLGIISDPPDDCRDLLMQVLHTLTDGAVPSPDLISSIKNLYSKTKDIEFLFAILAHLPKDEVLPVFPSIVNLPMDKFRTALSRILQGSPRNGPSLDPSEILIAIHVIDPDKEGIPLKKVIDACAACFEQRTIFTQQVLAKALNQLVEQIPLPLLFMRTVMQAIGAFPALVEFVMEIMSRLVSKQIWKYPKLWVGFLKCAILTKPQSYGVLLQLPVPQLENALSKNPTLKAPLVEHANQPNVRSTLPRSTLVVLGLAEEQQQQPPPPASQAQSSQNQAAETSSSAADTTTEVTQESSAAS